MKNWMFAPDLADLKRLAAKAEHAAQLIIEFERKPWRRTAEQNDMVDTYQQFAAYTRRIISHIEE